MMWHTCIVIVLTIAFWGCNLCSKRERGDENLLVAKRQKLDETTDDPVISTNATITLPNGSQYKVIGCEGSELVLQGLNSEERYNKRTIGGWRYALLNSIGEGGYSSVYLALDAGYGQRLLEGHSNYNFVAVKEVAEGNLAKEVAIQSGLNHPNVAKLLNCVPNCMYSKYAILEYVDGATLLELTQKGHHSDGQIAAVLEGLLEGLLYLQKREISHGDLFLRNIMVSRDGIVKIIDFGEAERGLNHNYDCSKLALLILNMHGFRGVMAYKENASVKKYLSLIGNRELKNFYYQSKLGSLEDLLSHPFIVNTPHSTEDLAQYARNPAGSGFRRLP